MKPSIIMAYSASLPSLGLEAPRCLIVRRPTLNPHKPASAPRTRRKQAKIRISIQHRILPVFDTPTTPAVVLG